MPLHLATLGRLHLEDDSGTPIRPLLAQPKRCALLVYLALQPEGRFTRRDTLLGLFWPELSQERARVALRKSLHFLRQYAGETVIESRGNEDVAIRSGVLRTDAADLVRAAAEGRTADALQLYGGEFLPGFFIASGGAFEQWLDGVRAELRATAARCAWAEAEGAERAGAAEAAREMGARAVALSPEDEAALRRYLSLLLRLGDRTAAIAAYRAFATHLEAEYGVSPSPETAGLIETLRAEETGPLPAVAAPFQLPPVERAPERPSGTGAPARRKWRSLLAAGALGLPAAAILAWISLAAEGDPGNLRLAVLPFSVSAPGEVAYLGTGMALLLAERMDEAGGIDVVEVRPSGDPEGWPGAHTLAEAPRTAERLNAGLYVVGAIDGTRERIRVTASLYDRARGRRALVTAAVAGSERSLHALADQLANRLIAGYLQERGAELAAGAARTTESPEALKRWLRGEDAFRRGRVGDAVEEFTAATAADSGFALAYYRLAVAQSWAGQVAEARGTASRAVALQDRLGEAPRLLARALLAARENRYTEARALYQQATAAHPDEPEAWFELAELIFHRGPSVGEPLAASRHAFEEVLRLDADFFPAMVHLARIAGSSGDTAALDRHSAAALQGEPTGAHAREMLLLRAFGLGDREALARVAPLPADRQTLDALWRASEYTPHPSRAASLIRTLQRSTAPGETRTALHLLLAHLEAARGCTQGTEQALDSLEASAPGTARLTRALLAVPEIAAAAPPAHPLDLAGAGRATAGEGVFAGSPIRGVTPNAVRILEWMLSAPHAPSPSAGAGPPYGAAERAFYAARSARTEGERADARRALQEADSSALQRFPNPSPFLPRALLHLAAADLLRRDGRPEEALQRLRAAPEDFGFNAALLPAVAARRAVLHRSLGRHSAAAEEDARWARMRTGCTR